VKEFLRQKQIAFTEKDVTTDVTDLAKLPLKQHGLYEIFAFLLYAESDASARRMEGGS
jgi:hypothetical protein